MCKLATHCITKRVKNGAKFSKSSKAFFKKEKVFEKVGKIDETIQVPIL